MRNEYINENNLPASAIVIDSSNDIVLSPLLVVCVSMIIPLHIFSIEVFFISISRKDGY